MLLVLCLNDFESLLKHSEEFDNGFYDNLRSLMNDNALMLVVASRKELSVYGSEYRFVCFVFQPGSRSQAGQTDYWLEASDAHLVNEDGLNVQSNGYAAGRNLMIWLHLRY